MRMRNPYVNAIIQSAMHAKVLEPSYATQFKIGPTEDTGHRYINGGTSWHQYRCMYVYKVAEKAGDKARYVYI